MAMDFTNKHFVVTGGTGALGSALTEELLSRGAVCSIPCYDKSELENFENEEHEQVYIRLEVDLANEDATQDFYEKAVEQHGTLWGSVHIAGGFGMKSIEGMSKADFLKQINMNLVTCFNSCKSAIASLRDKGGRIVNIASRPALEPRQGAGMSAYTTAKAGVAALTQSLAAEVIEDEILINAVAPSIIDTPANRGAMPNANYDQWPKPSEIAHQILYLVSEQNTVTRGAIVPVYGQS